MAAVSDSSAVSGDGDAVSGGDADNHGFRRPEMNSCSLPGTVDHYDCHLFLSYKTPDSWPSRAEGHDADLLPRFLAAALKSRKIDIPRNIRLTVCEGREGSEFANGDILIFPDMVRYRGLSHLEVDNFVENVLVRGGEWTPGNVEALKGSYVFVCAHGSRDKRCGFCGPLLVERFQQEIELQGLSDQVFVSPCSHVGGHKYAGNVIIFSSDGKNISGHWYGYVTPQDVPVLLDKHIGKMEIVDRLWRGQMGLSSEEQKSAYDLRRMLKGEENGYVGERPCMLGSAASEEACPDEIAPTEEHCNAGIIQAEDATVTEEVMNENIDGFNYVGDFGCCCQDTKEFTCCRDPNAGPRTESASDKHGTYLEGLMCWLKRWDEGDTRLALGIAGIVTSVAVAYSFYRRYS